MISGIIGNGAGGLTKTGTGTWTLSGVNTYTGATTINAGTLSVGTIGNGGVAGNLGAASTNAANLTLGGGTLQYTGATASTTRSFVLTTGTTSTIDITNAATNLTISGASTNTTGSLTKIGAGTLTLSGLNLYTGATNIGTAGGVSGGTLAAGINSALSSGTVNVFAGTYDLNTRTDTIGALNLGGGASGTAAAVTIGNGGRLTLGGNVTYNATNNANGATITGTGTGSLALGATRTFTIGDSTAAAADLTVSAIISGSGFGITKAGAGQLTLSGVNTYSGTTTVNAGTLLASGSSSLGATTGNVTVSAGTLALAGGAAITSANPTNAQTITKSGMLSLSGSGASASTGALHAAGSTGQTSQWLGDITLAGNATISAADNLLIVGDGNTFANTVNLGANTLTFNTSSATGVTPEYLPLPSYLLDSSNIVVNSTISGSGGIVKTGAGTVNLISNGANSYTGSTVITGGKLIIDGPGGAPVISSTSVTVGNAVSPGLADTVVLQMGQAASPPAPSDMVGTYDNVLNVASTSMTVNADGLFNMNGGSNALANLTLQGGHVDGGDPLALYSPVLTITGGVTTNASSQTALINNGHLAMSANAFAFNIAKGTSATDLQIDSIVENGIGFTNAATATSFAKTGSGTLVLRGTNTYQGVTDVQAGILNIQNASALGQTGPSQGSLSNGTTVQTGAQLQLQGNITVGNETLTLAGTGIASDGALLNYSGNNTYNGSIRLGADSRINANLGTTLSIANTLGTGAGIINGDIAGRNLTVGGAGNTAINSGIGGNISNVTKDGIGTLTLAGSNGYTGATAITAGAVKVTHNNGLSGTGVTVSSGSALQFAQDISNANISAVGIASTISGTGLSNGGAIQNLTGSNAYAGNITLAANARIAADSGSALTLSGNVAGATFALDAGGAGNTTYNGAISGTGTTLTKNDAGTVTLGGTSANTFTGATTVNQGTLNLNKTAGVNALGSTAITVGGGASAANLVLQASNQIADTAAVTIGANGKFALATFSESIASIAGTGQLDLGTTGNLTIGANNSSSTFGGTITGSGTLEKLGTGNLTFSNSVNFSSGTLQLGGGTLVLNNGIDVTVGTLNITGNSTIDFANTTTANLRASTLSFANTSITLTILNWTLAADYFFASAWSGATPDLLSNGNTSPMNQVVFSGFTPSQTGWDSLDNRIRPNVPEPSTYGALLLGSMSALVGFRRWRKSVVAVK